MNRSALLAPYIFCCFCIFLQVDSNAQSIDSLLEVANGNQPADERMKAYRALAYYSDDDSLKITYGQKALNLSKKAKKDDYIDAVFRLSYTYRKIGRFENAITLLDSFKTTATDSLLIAKVHNEIANVHEAEGTVSKALLYMDTAFSIYKRLGATEEAAWAKALIGRHYYAMGDYSSAIKHYEVSRKLYEENEIVNRNYGHLLHFIGSVYKRQDNLETALRYYEKQLKIANDLEDESLIAEALYLCASMYGELGDDKKALEYSLRALEIFEKKKDLDAVALMYGNISSWYASHDQQDIALDYLEKSYKIYRRLGVKDKLAWVMSVLGTRYSEQGQHNRGIAIIKASIDMAKQTERKQLLRLMENTHDLAWAYQRKGDYQNAFDAYREYIYFKDSLSDQQNNYYLQDLEAQYETAKKEQELVMKDEAISMQKALIEQKNKQNLLAIIAVILAIGVVIYIARLSGQRNKANKLLEHQNAQLERLSLVASKTENSVIILNPKGELEWMNTACRRLVGIDETGFDTIIGQPVSSLDAFKAFGSTFNTCKSEKKSVQYESSFVAHNGESRWHSSTITPIMNDAGVITKFIIIDTDITKQKVSEQIIQQKNVEITDSITYARKIQDAILTSDDFWENSFKDHFVLYKPRDIVSGDFYWAYETPSKKKIWAVSDCTGHGVPGAFMSMVGNSLLNEIVIENRIEDPDEILNQLRGQLIKTLRQNEDGSESQDGMDMAICCLDNGKLSYAGANNPLFLMREGKLQVFDPDKQPVGQYHGTLNPFTKKEVQVQQNDLLYLFTDGYVDQFGGKNNKKFLKRRFIKLVESISIKSLREQGEILDHTIEEWRGEFEQVDDICVVGVQV